MENEQNLTDQVQSLSTWLAGCALPPLSRMGRGWVFRPVRWCLVRVSILLLLGYCQDLRRAFYHSTFHSDNYPCWSSDTLPSAVSVKQGNTMYGF